MAFAVPKSPLALLVLFLSLVVVVLQIVALATNNWSNISNVVGNNQGTAEYLTLRMDVFSNVQFIATASDGSYTSTTYTRVCSVNDNYKNCARTKVAYAFTIMSVSLFGLSLVTALVLGKRAVVAGLLLTAATFGMIGWAVWFGSIHKDALNQLLTANGNTGPNVNFNIGFSQALAIAAWTIGYAAAVLTLVDSSPWRVGSE